MHGGGSHAAFYALVDIPIFSLCILLALSAVFHVIVIHMHSFRV